MHTLAMFIEPGVEAGGWGGEGVLVGRRVANEAFLRALVRYGDVARFLFFVGEQAQGPAVEAFVHSLCPEDPQRIAIAHRLDLPDLLAASEISVLHHESHWGWFFDLIALRDRFAPHHVPVTGQIHSLSYPRMLESYVRGYLQPPDVGDAVFCSSVAGRLALDESLELVRDVAVSRGWNAPEMKFERAMVPLGVDVEALERSALLFSRATMRARLSIPDDAVVLLCLGRFSEYDKMDLFPLVRVFSRLLTITARRDVHLVLAGARQGTGTPEMVKLWAEAMGVLDRVHLVIDFPVAEKGAWLACADAFVSPSDNVQETFGLSVIEAMALGVPVIVSDFDGYRDTVPPEVGWRVRTVPEADLSSLADWGLSLYERPLHLLLGQGTSVDPQSMLATLVEVCAEAPLRALKGAAAKTWAAQHYAWNVVIGRYEAVWQRLRMNHKRNSCASTVGMDYGRVFSGHYATAPDSAILVPSIFEDALKLHLHPEMKVLFDLPDVHYALSLVGSVPLSSSDLCRHLAVHRFRAGPKGSLAAQLLCSWLLKHGLVQRREA